MFECSRCGEICDSDELPQGWVRRTYQSVKGLVWTETLCNTCKVLEG